VVCFFQTQLFKRFILVMITSFLRERISSWGVGPLRRWEVFRLLVMGWKWRPERVRGFEEVGLKLRFSI